MAIANIVLQNLGGVNIFHANLLIAPEKRECLEKIPTFYKEVIFTWERICIGTSCDLKFILSQILWDNHFVRSRHKTISNKRLEFKGILTVVDLIDEDGKFSSWEKLSRKFNLSAVDFLEWYRILHSIHREWKNRVKENTFLPETLDKQVLSRFHHGVFKGTWFYDIFKVKASHIYEIFVHKRFKPPTAKAKISAKFKITEDLWSRIYTMASKCTLDTKTRIFQFKILNNVLYLNKQYYKMNLSVSPLCSVCLKEQETFTHLFLECSYSSNLGRELQKSLSPKLSLPNLNVKHLMVGFIENKSTQIIVNHILLLFKRYIYLRKLQNKSVHFVGFKFFTRTIMKVEEKYLRKKVRSLCTTKNGTL